MGWQAPSARDAAEVLAEAFDRQGSERSARELALLVRGAVEASEEQTSEFDGPGGRFGESLPGVPRAR